MKKIILTTLTATALMGTTVFANITDFADYNTDFGYGKISGHWGENELTVLHDNGGLNGTAQADGSFRLNPNKEVTVAEFLAMLFQATGTTVTQHAGLSWVDNMYQNAFKIGLLGASGKDYTGNYSMGNLPSTDEVLFNWENVYDGVGYDSVMVYTDAGNFMESFENCGSLITKLNTGNTTLSREDMAIILYNACVEFQGLDGLTSTLSLGKSTVNEVSTLMNAGLLSAVSNYNDFRPSDSLTKTEASAVVNRMVYNTDRLTDTGTSSADASVRPNYESYTEVFAPVGTVAEIITSLSNRDMISKNISQSTKLMTYDTFPQEGDMFNGSVITKDPWTGVLAFGEGQTGGIWAAPEDSGNEWLKTDFADPYHAGVKTNTNYYEYAGGKVEERAGYSYTLKEWSRLCEKAGEYYELTYPNTLPTNGPLANAGLAYCDIYGNKTDSMDSPTTTFYYDGFDWCPTYVSPI